MFVRKDLTRTQCLVEMMERVGVMQNVKDKEDCINLLCCLIRELKGWILFCFELVYCPFLNFFNNFFWRKELCFQAQMEGELVSFYI